MKAPLAILTLVSFLITGIIGPMPSYARDFSINQLPVPGTMIGKSAPFAPLALKGLIVNPQKPLEFQFIVDTGPGPQDTASVKEQANQLVKYFLAGLTIPEGDLWVNLSPYEKDRMIPEVLGQTDLGRDLLAQDYILKQLTASLIYPEKDLGKAFWSKVYAKAQEQFGTTNVPVNTFNKVWILPDQAQVFENVNAAYVTKSTLKVMLDEDYLALQKHSAASPLAQRNDTHSIGANIVRQIILPEIEKEVNTGKNFAPLRQIYQALILAKWYKETIQNGLLDTVYTNKKKIAGVNLDDPAVKEQIYERYLKAYKKGAFNYIKEDSTPDGQVVPRKYFSGGIPMMTINLKRTNNSAMLSEALTTAGTTSFFSIIFGLGAAMEGVSAQNTQTLGSSDTAVYAEYEKTLNSIDELRKEGLRLYNAAQKEFSQKMYGQAAETFKKAQKAYEEAVEKEKDMDRFRKYFPFEIYDTKKGTRFRDTGSDWEEAGKVDSTNGDIARKMADEAQYQDLLHQFTVAQGFSDTNKVEAMQKIFKEATDFFNIQSWAYVDTSWSSGRDFSPGFPEKLQKLLQDAQDIISPQNIIVPFGGEGADNKAMLSKSFDDEIAAKILGKNADLKSKVRLGDALYLARTLINNPKIVLVAEGKPEMLESVVVDVNTKMKDANVEMPMLIQALDYFLSPSSEISEMNRITAASLSYILYLVNKRKYGFSDALSALSNKAIAAMGRHFNGEQEGPQQLPTEGTENAAMLALAENVPDKAMVNEVVMPWVLDNLGGLAIVGPITTLSAVFAARDWWRKNTVKGNISRAGRGSYGEREDAMVWLIKNSSPEANEFLKKSLRKNALFSSRAIFSASLAAPLNSPARLLAEQMSVADFDKTVQEFKLGYNQNLVRSLIGSLFEQTSNWAGRASYNRSLVGIGIYFDFSRQLEVIKKDLTDVEFEKLIKLFNQEILSNGNNRFEDSKIAGVDAVLQKFNTDYIFSDEVKRLAKLRGSVKKEMEKAGFSETEFQAAGIGIHPLSLGGLREIARIQDAKKDFYIAASKQGPNNKPYKETHYSIKAKDAAMLNNVSRMTGIQSQIDNINKSGQYQAEVISQQGHTLIKFTDQKETNTNFTIMVDKGFRVISWAVAGKEMFRVPQDLEVLGAGIFSMFPWVNRLKNGEIVRNGRTIYITSEPNHNMEKIQRNGQEAYLQTIPGLSMDGKTDNPIHGVARVSEHWKDLSVGMDDEGTFIQASFETTDYPGLSEVFGHSKLTKKFHLNGPTLTTDVEIENLMTEAEAARDGGWEVIADVGEHHFKRVTPGKTTLQIEGVEGVFPVDGQKIPTGAPETVPVEKNYNTPRIMEGGELDNTFTVRANAKGTITATMVDQQEKRTTTMTLEGMFSAKPGELAVVHGWSGSSDKNSPYYGISAVEPVPVTANGPNRIGEIGGSRPLSVRGDKKAGRITMTVTDQAMLLTPNEAKALIIDRLPPGATAKLVSKDHIEQVIKFITQGDDFRVDYYPPGVWADLYAPKALPEKIEITRVDKAALAQSPGGIDLNQINVLRNGKTVNVQFDPAQLNELMQGGFEGFTPVIINITHISSPLQLLGINPEKLPEPWAKA